MDETYFTDTIFTVLTGILIAVILILIWLTPVICSRKNENATPILWINILLGWIPLVWLALLIAALLGKKK